MTMPFLATSAGVPRWTLVALGLLTALGGAAELALERHWGDPVKLIPWFALGAVVAALIVVATVPHRLTVAAARVIAACVIVASAYGVYAHVEENHKAGPLDFRYSESWSSMSSFEQWWKAATKTVGPAPVLAPGLLAMAALLLLASTYCLLLTNAEG